ncbi:ROK family protein [Periweissella cryptocerci]|uniref:ROK family protein n=1 Tax=Periweissella cryptocerci TaxID=2506420 RepID=A0A4P6YTK7_9LACO|nr:ROK family protein [Periweissella cryptocerci]QBO36003.1 ROK family protein [Periweissella cryptocerci]
MAKSMNQDVMRATNRKLVLQHLFNHPQTSQVDIANSLQLHKSTISSIYRELEEEGYIEELGQGESTNVGGRRPMLVTFNRQFGHVVDFDMGRHHLRVMVTRLNGDILEYTSINTRDMTGREIVELMKAETKKHDGYKTNNGLMGIAVAVHGVVFGNRVMYSPFIDLSTIDLAAELKSEFDVPVILENEANLSAVYLRDFHDYDTEANFSNMISVNIHNGIGLGVIIDGQLYRGFQGQAGELGHSVPVDGRSTTNASARLEDLYSEDALFERLAEKKQIEYIDRQGFMEFYAQRDSCAVALVDEWVIATAQIIFNTVQQYAPEVVFIHSRIMSLNADLLQRVLVIYESLQPYVASQVAISSSSVEYATLLGGTAQIVREVLDLQTHALSFRKPNK